MRIRLTSLLVALAACVAAGASERSYNIVFIGNSITYGALHENRAETAPPAACARWLAGQEGVGDIHFENCGRSGRTTYHFLPNKEDVVPAGDRTYFSDVVKRTTRLVGDHPDLPLVFSIMLGTNDSAERPRNHRTTPEDYVRNMTVIIDSLLALWPDAHVVVHRAIYYTPGFTTGQGSVLDGESLAMLRAYYDRYPDIVARYSNGHVHIGDTLAYGYFRENNATDTFLEKGRNGESFHLHPNEKGAKVLGQYWGEAIRRILSEVESPRIYVSCYSGDRRAAISYTFDDGLLEHFTVVRGQLKKHRFPATFAIIGSKVGRDQKGTPTMTWSQLSQLRADGHEIASHGFEHRNVTTLSAEELRHEVQANDSIIGDSVGVWPRTFFYPGNRHSHETVAVCEKGRVGSRTKQMSLGSKRTDEELRRWVDGLIGKGGWEVTMTHGISYGYDHFSDPATLWRHFDYVDSLRQKIWVATLADVSAYTKERRAVFLDVRKHENGTTSVTPRLGLDKSLFNVPLTMVVRTDRHVTATQDGQRLEVKSRDGRQLIDFNPHGGPVIISEATIKKETGSHRKGK